MRRRRLEFSDALALVLQKRRTAKKLSRQALSEKAGLHQTYVGLIERGKSNPSVDAASALTADGMTRPLFKGFGRKLSRTIASIEPRRTLVGQIL